MKHNREGGRKSSTLSFLRSLIQIKSLRKIIVDKYNIHQVEINDNYEIHWYTNIISLGYLSRDKSFLQLLK